jgi:hypothetical protein
MKKTKVEDVGRYEPRYQPQLWAICEREVRWLRKEYVATFHRGWTPAKASKSNGQLGLSSGDAPSGDQNKRHSYRLKDGLPLGGDPAEAPVSVAGQESPPDLEFPVTPPGSQTK